MRGDKQQVVDSHVLDKVVLEGFMGISVAYRSSTKAIFPAQIQDVVDALRWVRSHHEDLQVDPARIAVAGYSSGAHLAALLATSRGRIGDADSADPSPQAVVVIAGPTDLTSGPEAWPVEEFPWQEFVQDGLTPGARLLGGPVKERAILAAQANPLTYIDSSPLPPFLLIYGAEDDGVPIAQGEVLHQALKAAGHSSHFVRVEDADHRFSSRRDPSMGGIAALDPLFRPFLKKYLQGPQRMHGQSERTISLRDVHAAHTAGQMLW